LVDRRKCSICGRPGHDRRSCGKLGRGRKPFDPWSDLEWDQHEEAREIVAAHPDGMTLEQVGAVLGVTRERVRQIEAAALFKLRDGVNLADAVTVDGVTVAVLICERCDSYYPRQGRSKICPDCADPPPRKKPRVVRRKPKKPPVVEVVDVADLEIPTPDPGPAIVPGFSFSLTFDFSDL
jgi:hypothetical protein